VTLEEPVAGEDFCFLEGRSTQKFIFLQKGYGFLLPRFNNNKGATVANY
jgi:hypothetical protein